MIQVYHNARCSKSRECLLALDEANQEISVRNYLAEPPTVEEIRDLLLKLKMRPIELIRIKEPIWKEKFASKDLSDAEIIQAMADHPILIERPIAVNGDKAVIARPASKINDIL